MYLVTMSVALYLRQRQCLAGLCLAGSIVVKIFPGLLLVYFVARRKFAVAAITMLWLFVLVVAVPSGVFGVSGNFALLRQWITTVALPANVPEGTEKNIRYDQMIDPTIVRNQSVQAVMIRLISGKARNAVAAGRENLARHVALAINAALFVVSVWAVGKGTTYSGRGRELMECSVMVLLMLFLAPVSWSHNYTQLVMPLAVVIGLAGCDDFSQAARVCRAGLVAFLVLSTLSLAAKSLQARGALLWGTLALWACLVWCLAKRNPHAQCVAGDKIMGSSAGGCPTVGLG
jgi:hypothetical protein